MYRMTAAQDNKLMLASINKQIADCNKKHESLAVEAAKLEATLAKITLSNEAVANLIEFRNTIESGLSKPTFEDKRYALESLKAAVKLFPS
ncbi:MAG: hypothetical protein HC853_00900 [Anaerolineae bacterium]|nr:hypothetical protein [Anaerolineae bacterium]